MAMHTPTAHPGQRTPGALRVALWLLPLLALLTPAQAASAADLYREDQYRALLADQRARRVGDLLTVQVLENASASATADLRSQRKHDASLGVSAQDSQRPYRAGLGANLSDSHDGSARTQRAGRVLAQITVTVTSVEPNGDLRIRGEQQLELNGEQQRIGIEGRVRPQDINDTNTVVSSRLADARIRYLGDGVLAEAQRPGWLSRVMRWLGL